MGHLVLLPSPQEEYALHCSHSEVKQEPKNEGEFQNQESGKQRNWFLILGEGELIKDHYLFLRRMGA